jgi:hypothetical protein
MRTILIFCSIIIFQSQVTGQSPFNGLFTNDADEFFCIDNNNIWFRINNNDAFGTFTIGKGKFEIDKKGKLHLKNSSSLISKTSIIKQYPRNDNCIVITAIYEDSIPMQFVKIEIEDLQNKGHSFIYSTDINGQLLLSEEQIKFFIDTNVSIRIVTLGFTTEKTLKLIRGYDFVIQSTIPSKIPFHIVGKTNKIIIKEIDTQRIKVKAGYSLTSILYKTQYNCLCSDSLFSIENIGIIKK